MSNKHLIGRQRIRIRLTKQSEVKATYDQVSSLVRNRLTSRLAEVFDELAGPDERLVIDRLVIKVGEVSRDDFEEEFIQRAITKLREQIEQMRRKGELPQAPAEEEGIPVKGSSAQRPDQHAAALQLLQFLSEGTLPWWSSGGEEGSPDVLLATALSSSRAFFVRELRDRPTGLHLYHRLRLQLSEASLKDLNVALWGEAWNWQQEYLRTIGVLLQGKVFGSHLTTKAFNRLLLATNVRVFASSTPPARAPGAWLKQLIDGLAEMRSVTKTAMRTSVLQAAKEVNDTSNLRAEVLAELRAAAVIKEATEDHLTTPELALKLLDDPQRRKTAAAKTGESPSSKLHPLEDALYLHNSGLVILAPFLPRYFDMLGILEGKVFPNETTAARAVLLLEYLVSGRSEAPEHELVLNKVFCGLDIGTPVPLAIELTEQEVEVSRQMLNAVLQNWDKMSNSTIENLRGSFLLRDGLLLEREDHWSLRVESKGFDVILSFLPWTINVLSLPWMDRRVEVDWNTSFA